MKNQIVPFWTWNKRKSPMTMTPKQKPSLKAPPIVRTFQKLAGIKFGHKGMKQMLRFRKLKN